MGVLKAGLVGCGAIGKDHCRRLIETIPGVTVVAVSDYVAAAADSTAEKYGIRSFGNDCSGMIQDPEVEAVVIASSDATHFTYVMQTLEAGKWCFCEKPLAQKPEDCEAIIRKEVELGKRLLQVGFMRRYDKGYAEMRRIIASGELGNPLIIKAAHRNWLQPAAGYEDDHAVSNMAIHELDVSRFLLGEEYKEGQCVQVRQNENTPAFVNPQIILIRTRNNCYIEIEVQVSDAYGYDIQCEVVCEKGTVKLPDPYTVVRRQRPADGCKPGEIMPILEDWKDRFVEAYDIEFNAWVKDIADGKLTGPSAWDGYAACAAAKAVNASRGTGQFVPIEMIEKPELYKG